MSDGFGAGSAEFRNLQLDKQVEMGSFAIVACVLVALLGCVGAESSVGLGPLEFGKFSPPEDKFHVKASAAGPGSRELR